MLRLPIIVNVKILYQGLWICSEPRPLTGGLSQRTLREGCAGQADAGPRRRPCAVPRPPVQRLSRHVWQQRGRPSQCTGQRKPLLIHLCSASGITKRPSFVPKQVYFTSLKMAAMTFSLSTPSMEWSNNNWSSGSHSASPSRGGSSLWFSGDVTQRGIVAGQETSTVGTMGR